MISPVTHLLPLTNIRRARMLPDKGNVLVSVNQRVNAGEVVAESPLIGHHTILDVRKAFGLEHFEDAHKLVRYKIGEGVEKGDILAQTGGIFPRIVRAPVSGTVVSVNRGQIILEQTAQKLELMAGIAGTVAEILPDRGVVIESNGALIQGVWGNGRINQGMLLITDQPPEEEFTRSSLDLSMRGAIVLAGYVSKADALEAADSLPVRGLILSSMAATLIPLAMKVSYPIILIEGFGQVAMNNAAYQLLITNEKREICLNGEWDASRAEKPEIFIPLPAQGNPLQEFADLSAGKTVRVNVPPYSGQSATLVSLLPGMTTLANGKRVQAANIRLSNNRVVPVPLANLDVLE